jgi:DNA-binding response OmpR family regulator
MVEALSECRFALTTGTPPGKAPPASRIPGGPKTLCVIEANPKLQEAFRGLNKKGYRVLLSVDPGQAVRQYQTKPYHALIVDCGTVGQDGVEAYNRVLKQSDAANLDVAAVAILNEDQQGLRSQATVHPRGAVLVRPVGLKQVLHKIRELVPELVPDAVGE